MRFFFYLDSNYFIQDQGISTLIVCKFILTYDGKETTLNQTTMKYCIKENCLSHFKEIALDLNQST